MEVFPPEIVKIYEEIRDMKIRGAGRIARAAAMALRMAAEIYTGDDERTLEYLSSVASYIGSSRPTAVSLPNALHYVLSRVKLAKRRGIRPLKEVAIRAADQFIKYSLRAVEMIGKIGAGRIKDGDVVMTHCNSTAALSVIFEAWRRGKRIKVYATETRPKFQGRITAKALASKGIPVVLIPDSAVRYFMKDVDKVVLGADAVAANGAVVNKIGTSLIALSAHEARVRVFVMAITYKFNPETIFGELIEIAEEEPQAPFLQDMKTRTQGAIKALSPLFDVTPPEYIDAIITERGIIAPQAASLVLIEEYGRGFGDYLASITSDIEDEGYVG